MLINYDTISIFQALTKGEGLPFHPRLSGEDIARLQQSPHFAGNIEMMKQAGEELLSKPIPTLLYSDYRQYDETGERANCQKDYSDRRHRLNVFGILAVLFPENKEYITALEDIIWAICDEYTWSVPAHLLPCGTDVRVPRVRYNEKGLIDNSEFPHVHQLDLFACETSFALCEITALLEERLAPLVVYRARTECYRRILTPYLDLTGLWKWEKGTNNWSAVCAGSIGMTAMYLIQDSSVLTPVIQRLLATMDGFLSGFSDDGTCVEGPSYWRYGMSFFSGFAETLRRRSEGGINLFAIDKVRAIAEYQQKCYMTGNYVVSFSDTAKQIDFRLGLAVFLKNEYDTVRIPDLNQASPVLTEGSHRWCTDYRDVYWVRNFDFKQDEEPESVHYMADAQQFIAKLKKGGSTCCFAIKGGHNAQPHNHNDVGSLIYHIDGDSLLIDLGRGKYSKEYFHGDRYGFICNGSQGHSVPIVDGAYQKPGREFACTQFNASEGSDGYRVDLDMQNAYGLPHVTGLHRNALFSKDGGLTVTDICESTASVDFTSRFVTKCRIVQKDGRLYIKGSNMAAEVIYDDRKCNLSFDEGYMEVHSSEEPPQSGKNVFMINITSKNRAQRHEITVRFRPLVSEEI